MLYQLLQQYWHDNRFDKGKVRVRYIDRGAPEDRSCVNGPGVWPEPYYMAIRHLMAGNLSRVTGYC